MLSLNSVDAVELVSMSFTSTCRRWREFMMTDMTDTGTGMTVTVGIYHVAIFVFAVLGSAAAIKYLRS
jgi:hypothetical protein